MTVTTNKKVLGTLWSMANSMLEPEVMEDILTVFYKAYPDDREFSKVFHDVVTAIYRENTEHPSIQQLLTYTSVPESTDHGMLAVRTALQCWKRCVELKQYEEQQRAIAEAMEKTERENAAMLSQATLLREIHQ